MAWYSKAIDWIKKNVFRIKENIETSNIDSKNSIKPEAQKKREDKMTVNDLYYDQKEYDKQKKAEKEKPKTPKKRNGRNDVMTDNTLYEPSNTFDKKNPSMGDPKELESIYSTIKTLSAADKARNNEILKNNEIKIEVKEMEDIITKLTKDSNWEHLSKEDQVFLVKKATEQAPHLIESLEKIYQLTQQKPNESKTENVAADPFNKYRNSNKKAALYEESPVKNNEQEAHNNKYDSLSKSQIFSTSDELAKPIQPSPQQPDTKPRIQDKKAALYEESPVKNNGQKTQQTPNYTPKPPELTPHRSPPPPPQEDKQSEKQQDNKPPVPKRQAPGRPALPDDFPPKEILSNFTEVTQTNNTAGQPQTPRSSQTNGATR